MTDDAQRAAEHEAAEKRRLRFHELNKLTKVTLCRMARQGGTEGAHPLEQWRKDEVIYAIIDQEVWREQVSRAEREVKESAPALSDVLTAEDERRAARVHARLNESLAELEQHAPLPLIHTYSLSLIAATRELQRPMWGPDYIDPDPDAPALLAALPAESEQPLLPRRRPLVKRDAPGPLRSVGADDDQT